MNSDALQYAQSNKSGYQAWSAIAYQRQGYADYGQNAQVHANMNKNLAD